MRQALDQPAARQRPIPSVDARHRAAADEPVLAVRAVDANEQKRAGTIRVGAHGRDLLAVGGELVVEVAFGARRELIDLGRAVAIEDRAQALRRARQVAWTATGAIEERAGRGVIAARCAVEEGVDERARAVGPAICDVRVRARRQRGEEEETDEARSAASRHSATIYRPHVELIRSDAAKPRLHSQSLRSP